MAKRRNPKKEKALRNQAYARKFRKRSSGRFGRRFSHNDNRTNENKAGDTANTEDASEV